MRGFVSIVARGLLALLGLVWPVGLAAQGAADRPPNISGDWVLAPGTMQFNFLHRFVTSPKPVRKVSNFPTFLVAFSALKGTTLGFNYSTNSTLTPAYPNEWEFFGRIRPWTQAGGSPFDVAGQIGYNLAAKGLDGELSLARWMGPVRLIGVGRVLSDPYTSDGSAQFAVGGGAVLRLTRHLSATGDVASLTDRSTSRGEKVAWSAGLAVVIPNTPHTLSLHATNTNTGTLQGASRGGSQVRYGFEFTIPLTLSRYFGHKPRTTQPPAATPAAGSAAAPGMVPAGEVTGPVARSGMQALRYTQATIEIAAGTTVEWKNDDQLQHSVTADDGSFDSGLIDGGQVWRYTFTRPGTYSFHCTPHPFMKGVVIVR
jgi:plastocyanin